MGNNFPADDPLEHVGGEKPRFEILIILLVSIFSSTMFGMALLSLGMESGPLANLKYLVITGAAGLVAYGVNRTAIEVGAQLAAQKFFLAGFVSVAAMMVVGAGLFLATFSGLTNRDVAELEVQAHGTELVLYTGAQNRVAARSSRAGAIIRIIEADLFDKARCEVESSCISGRGDGGRGTVALALEELAKRAGEIALAFERGETARQDALDSINAQMAEYQKVLGESETGIRARRLELLQIDARIDQEVTRLKEAVPTSLLKSYASELSSGFTIPQRPVATRRMNEILKTHGRALDEILGSISGDEVPRPVFPALPGVLDVLGYFGSFAHIGLVVLVVEGVLPITVWTMTFLSLSWEIEKEKRRREAAKSRQQSAHHRTVKRRHSRPDHRPENG